MNYSEFAAIVTTCKNNASITQGDKQVTIECANAENAKQLAADMWAIINKHASAPALAFFGKGE